MAYGEHCAERVDRAAEVISVMYLGGLQVTENNARSAIREAIWHQLTLATACGFDPDQLIEEIVELCKRATEERG
jgi:hypothetical protein